MYAPTVTFAYRIYAIIIGWTGGVKGKVGESGVQWDKNDRILSGAFICIHHVSCIHLRFRHYVAEIYYGGIFFVDKISTSCCKDIL